MIHGSQDISFEIAPVDNNGIKLRKEVKSRTLAARRDYNRSARIQSSDP